MLSLKRAFESVYPDGFFIAQRGAERPADRNADKTVDSAELGKALMAWQCQRPNNAYNEKRLFDENYKTIFRPDYDPSSVLALQTWMNAIERAWPNLHMNDALRAGKSYVRYHILFAVSCLIAYASGQGDKIPVPAATLHIAQQHSHEVLPLAANCVDQALTSAVNESQAAGRVFSPQNWCKNRASVQSESLVASTMIGMLRGMNGQAVIDKLQIPSQQFGLRWSAD
jgi:hypothetical protein